MAYHNVNVAWAPGMMIHVGLKNNLIANKLIISPPASLHIALT